ncbi:MAG: hypothetical protein JWO12_1192, partial [Frankiales bacterium]|nr:hypothetical protein [Frankiales bacterium]
MAFPRCALALVGALLATGAWTPPVQAEEAQLSAVLTLADRPTTAQLHRLASQHPSSAHVTALAPKRSHRDAVVAFARGKHLDVVRADDWSVTVSGPASVLRDALTTGLPPDVASVVGLDNRRLHRAHASPDGLANPQTAASLRAHYDVPASWRGNGITVGVLNLAGWNKGDLQQFADHEGIAVRPGQITTIPVGADPTKLDGFGDEYEVALDAEAVLGSAPEAAQRLYFAPNTSAGVVSGFEQMAADAAAGLVQVVTTSWGSCERDFDETATDSDRAAYASALDRIVAAGATVFAASGDAGAFDCGTPEVPDDEAQVDFPASYGNVVAVGGTTLKAGLPESSWSEPGFAGYLGDGSGGGQSVEQPLPGYQDGIVAGATRRLVPDVASDADPQSGLGIYVRTQGGWSSAGGTSLASPTWAGMLASALSSQGGRSGRGNILPALYTSDGFTDVVDGHNGLFSARPGYDLVTGLGVPQWSRLGPALLASSPGASATGPTSFVRRPPRSADPSIRALYTRAVDAPIRVTLPKGSSYTGFSAGERVPGCALQQATPPTTAALLPHPSQGEHQLVLTALDPALVCHQAVANVV